MWINYSKIFNDIWGGEKTYLQCTKTIPQQFYILSYWSKGGSGTACNMMFLKFWTLLASKRFVLIAREIYQTASVMTSIQYSWRMLKKIQWNFNYIKILESTKMKECELFRSSFKVRERLENKKGRNAAKLSLQTQYYNKKIMLQQKKENYYTVSLMDKILVNWIPELLNYTPWSCWRHSRYSEMFQTYTNQ